MVADFCRDYEFGQLLKLMTTLLFTLLRSYNLYIWSDSKKATAMEVAELAWVFVPIVE